MAQDYYGNNQEKKDIIHISYNKKRQGAGVWKKNVE